MRLFSLKKRLIIALVVFGIFSSTHLSFADEWKYEWRSDKMTGEQTCLVFSRMLPLSTGYGVSSVYLGIQSNGQFSLQSTDYPFDSRYLTQIGVRIDENAPILAPQKTANSKLFLFSESDSLLIQQQVAKGKEIRIQVVFFPNDERVSGVLSLSGIVQAIARYNGCRVLVNSQGWLGVYVVDLEREPKWMEWLKKHKKAAEPGVIVITTDPRKVAVKAGLEEGDAIIELNDAPVTVSSLIQSVTSMKAGEEINLTIVRGNRILKKKVTRP